LSGANIDLSVVMGVLHNCEILESNVNPISAKQRGNYVWRSTNLRRNRRTILVD
jgi:hypothetical protein